MYTRREFFSILISSYPPFAKGGKGGLSYEKREISECPECGRPYFVNDNADGCPICKKHIDKRVSQILFGKEGES